MIINSITNILVLLKRRKSCYSNRSPDPTLDYYQTAWKEK